jgi:CspA family cold shock protein
LHHRRSDLRRLDGFAAAILMRGRCLLGKKGKRMGAGKLKMWNADRGFGFIADDSGGPDMFLHISALQAAGSDPDNIRKGDRLTFDVESTREGKTRASNVRQG